MGISALFSKPAGPIKAHVKSGFDGDRPQPMSQAEFEQLAQAHHARALRFALAILGDGQRAEDIVQEALRRMFERRADYPLAAHFGPYLVKIMARLCIQEKRDRNAAARHEANFRRLQPQRAEDPARTAERSESFELVRQAVAGLPERQRVCLLLVVCEGFSYREVCDALSLTFGEVNNAVHRARLALRDRLGPALAGQGRGMGDGVR